MTTVDSKMTDAERQAQAKRLEENIKKDIGTMLYSDLLPHNRAGWLQSKEFLQRVASLLIDHTQKVYDRNSKILDFHHPEQLKEVLDLSIPDDPQNLDQLLVDCKDALKYQVKTGHPRFLNQLSTGLDLVSLAGEWLTAAANTNMFTYEIAPVFILVEYVTLRKMREVIGPSFVNGDSILAPGGSVSNLTAAMAARHKLFPEIKSKGVYAVKGELVMFTSDQSHYSAAGAGVTMGIGMDNVVHIKSDKRGRMMVSELENAVLKAKSEGKIPFFVNVTCGTTVLGAFDPINEIADLCEKYKMWCHCDCAWGGGLLLSSKHRHKMDGIDRADSVTWNPHKLMGTHLQCSTIHLKEDGLLLSCNNFEAEYLFQQDKHYDVCYDTGDKVIQCGRHNDIFKLWLQFRAKGMSGFEEHMDLLMDRTQYLVKQLKARKDKFTLLLEPELTNVSFWYLPKRVRTMKQGPERLKIIGESTAKLKGLMMDCGTLMVGYQPLGEWPNFFRSIFSNPGVGEDDIDFMLDEMDRLGADL